MTANCCTQPGLPIVLPLNTPPWARWRDTLAATVEAWRVQRAAQREVQALHGLSEETLRDIGMAERMAPRQPTLGTLDYERGRWV